MDKNKFYSTDKKDYIIDGNALNIDSRFIPGDISNNISNKI